MSGLRPPALFVVVFGDVQPAGSKRAFVNPKTKRAIVTDDNRKAGPWKKQVAQIVGGAHEGEPWGGPVCLELTFYRPRLGSHYGTGRNAGKLKDSAPRFPTTRPDALKLARGCEDAMSGIVYRDDSQIVEEHLYKAWGTARVEIKAWRL